MPSGFAHELDALIAEAVILDRVDLNPAFGKQRDAKLFDFGIDFVLHALGSITVDGGRDLDGVPRRPTGRL